MTTETAPTTPLAEASVSSLDEFFSRRPPFDEEALTAIVKELRRMREKWESLGEGTPVTAKKRAARAAAPPTQLTADDLWTETGE
jgi:hypothetical protein